MQYRKEEREEISILKEEKRRLQQTIRHLTNQNQNLEANIQRVKTKRNLLFFSKYFQDFFFFSLSFKKKYQINMNYIEKNLMLENY